MFLAFTEDNGFGVSSVLSLFVLICIGRLTIRDSQRSLYLYSQTSNTTRTCLTSSLYDFVTPHGIFHLHTAASMQWTVATGPCLLCKVYSVPYEISLSYTHSRQSPNLREHAADTKERCRPTCVFRRACKEAW